MTHDPVTPKNRATSAPAYPSKLTAVFENSPRALITPSRRVGYSVNRFLAYLRESGLLDSLAPKETYQPLLDAYLQWMRHYQHAADGTLQVRSHSITQFLQWLGPEAPPEGLSRLTAQRIESLFLRYAQSMGRSARRSMQSALRTFFRFCLQQGYIKRALDRAIPTLRTYKWATLPRGLSDPQAQQVLQSINRDSHAGRRDYAILQLLYTCCVRGGQVRALRPEDIDWAQNQILFPASKQGKDSRLPLTAQVGKSLLDYLQNSRPPYAHPHVFLTCRAPYHPRTHSSSLWAIAERHIRAAGIELSSKGAHTFRHGFATRMLHQDHSLKAVADVLGHRHLSTNVEELGGEDLNESLVLDFLDHVETTRGCSPRTRNARLAGMTF